MTVCPGCRQAAADALAELAEAVRGGRVPDGHRSLAAVRACRCCGRRHRADLGASPQAGAASAIGPCLCSHGPRAHRLPATPGDPLLGCLTAGCGCLAYRTKENP